MDAENSTPEQSYQYSDEKDVVHLAEPKVHNNLSYANY